MTRNRPSESTYRQMVADLAANGHSQRRPKRDISDEIVARVHEACESGERWATDVLERWDREGAERDYEAAHGSLNTTTYIRADGTRAKKTTSYSMPQRDVASGDVVAYVQCSFWDYDRPSLLGKRAEMAAQGARIADAVAAMDQVLDAWGRHPDCATAREAWEADGRSVDEISLGDVAS